MKLFDMLTDVDIKRIKEKDQLDLAKRVEDLEKSLSIALDVNDKYQRENKDLKKRAEEAEGEVTIVKGIGMNSPEMKDMKKQKEYLQSQCRKAGRALIELNLKYETNLKELDRLSEENTNLKVMLKGTNDTNNSG
jgi:hypothetical protein